MSSPFRLIVSGLFAAAAFPFAVAGQSTDHAIVYEHMVEHLASQRQNLIELRHDIHQHPEVSGSEKRTAALVAEHLDKLGFKVETGVGGHGVIGVLHGAHAGPMVAFRADMDAVRSSSHDPVEYRSLSQGVRHICGHDIHTTIGIGVAQAFAAVKQDLAGSVLLVFQPAEEAGTGAKAMLADGAFERVTPSAIFAVHTSPYNVGQIATMPGGLMAGRASFSVSISGDGDLADAASRVRVAIESVGNVSAANAQQSMQPGFIYVQIFPSGGSVAQRNLSVRGQIMTAGYKDRAQAKSSVLNALENLDLDSVTLERVTLKTEYDDGFMEGVTNDVDLVKIANDGIARFAPDVTILTSQGAPPIFSEDFGSFQLYSPGVMYFLGVSNSETGTRGMPHTPDYVADDSAIDVGVRAVLAAMLSRLAAN